MTPWRWGETMKTFNREISFQTKETFEFVKLTDKVQELVNKSGIKQGLALVKCPHTTAAVVITENDQDLHQDTKMMLENLLDLNWSWKHIYEGKINARAHQAALLFGNSVAVPITDGQLSLGTWQDIFFVECLEARSRKVEVLIMGE